MARHQQAHTPPLFASSCGLQLTSERGAHATAAAQAAEFEGALAGAEARLDEVEEDRQVAMGGEPACTCMRYSSMRGCGACWGMGESPFVVLATR